MRLTPAPWPPYPRQGTGVAFPERDDQADIVLTFNALDLIHYDPPFEWRLFYRYVMPGWYRQILRCGADYWIERLPDRDVFTVRIWLPSEPVWRRRASCACRPLIRWVTARHRERAERERTHDHGHRMVGVDEGAEEAAASRGQSPSDRT